MAITEQLGGSSTERIFMGTDWTKAWKVADYETDTTGATAKNISGMAFTFDIRKARSSTTALVSKTTASGLAISGSFNSVLATSTQVITLTIEDTDITVAAGFNAKGGTYYYSLKRTDSGLETIVKEGEIVIERATQI